MGAGQGWSSIVGWASCKEEYLPGAGLCHSLDYRVPTGLGKSCKVLRNEERKIRP